MGRRMAAKAASQSFGSVIARTTVVPVTSAFNYQNRSSFSTTLGTCLSTEITAELADDEIDHEFIDTKKQTEKIFTIVESQGEGRNNWTPYLRIL